MPVSKSFPITAKQTDQAFGRLPDAVDIPESIHVQMFRQSMGIEHFILKKLCA